MTSHYTVVQFVPDPTAGERMNIGVLAWDDKHVHSDFIRDFRRARAFSGKNVKFLEEFAAYVKGVTKDKSNNYKEFAPENIEKLISNWNDSIQFSEARGSTQTVSQLIRELPLRFLHDMTEVPQAVAQRVPPITVTRSAVIRKAYRAMNDVAKTYAPKKKYVQRNWSLPGKFNEHHFDVALVNGHAFGALNALSLGISSKTILQREIDATAWIFDDVRKKTNDLPLAVFISRGTDDDNLFEKTKKTFTGLNSTVIADEKKLVKWAGTLVQEKTESLAK